eukprot:TRINITY_DN13116_c0_g1_i1.p1 TRINITY_DN13116_c0_g1~~TRINITY_DN13116_c0_g1_i1.p1  ORF type:complete len:239 (-),score=23.17 TRINITY_DN13116_c0_g1_i1:277-993(-)
MLRALCFVVVLLLMLVSGRLAIFLSWLLGYLQMPCSGMIPKHFNSKKFNLGCLDQGQCDYIKKAKPVFGDPARYCKDGVLMKSGEVVACDIVICATGYCTGFDFLKFVKDGQPIDLNGKPLLHHAVVPCFPCLIVAPTACYHFGPSRGVTLAQYISYYAKASDLTEEKMEKIANSNFCSQSTSTFFAFDRRVCSTRQWLLMLIDLMRNGVLSIFEFIRLALKTFVSGEYIVVNLNVGD